MIGASAAGLLAAIFAARAGASVVLLETRPKPGAKIRVSGGGRCNLLPSEVEAGDFHTGGSPRTLRNILGSWPLSDVRSFFESELGIPLKTEATGKVFPRSERPLEVVEALLGECRRLNVPLWTSARVTAIRQAGTGFDLRCADERALGASHVILATGGLSLPKTGSDGGGFSLARRLGHDIASPFPVLVPLTTTDPHWHSLPGVSLTATLRAVQEGRVRRERTGGLLCTHRGWSGPVVLDLSRELTRPGGEANRLEVHWGGRDVVWHDLLRGGGSSSVGAVLREHLPRRLVERLVVEAGVEPRQRLAELPRPQRRRLQTSLEAFPLRVDGNEGYRTAEATGGGILLSDLHTRTLESRITPGLFFAGEMIDVDGRIGGYNFLWAWVSGRRAGEAAGLAARAQQRLGP